MCGFSLAFNSFCGDVSFRSTGGGRDLFSGHVGQQQQEQLECSCKQARRVVEIYENLKNTVDQLKKDMESGTGETDSALVLAFCSFSV